jgi:carboxynorspermidine decarboxylase
MVQKMRYEQLPTPCYVIDQSLLERNLRLLADLAGRSGAKILLAQKAFSMFSLYPLLGQYLCGTAASSLFEARLGHEEMGGETHIFAPAYREDEIEDIAQLSDHMVFNSFSQLNRYRELALSHGASLGLRINPECSTQEVQPLYDPCAKGSRLGVIAADFHSETTRNPRALDSVSGLHFHTLCEQNADALATTLDAVEEKFSAWLRLPQITWLNLGGGQLITRDDYDLPLLEMLIARLQQRYGVTVYLEPGEAVALDAGFLQTTVLDITHNGLDIAILDASAACHMPDVLEMPYRPPLSGAGLPGEKAHTYRLAGPTCLAGDVIGDYSFDQPLQPGDRLSFGDMAIYTMVKNNTFNGVNLPAIALREADGNCRVIRSFGYADFLSRLS